MRDTRSGRAGSGSDVVLAFDYGLKRLGVATANLATRTASPLTTLSVGREPPWAELDRLIEDWQPSALVVGAPGGDPSQPSVARARAFAQALEERYELPVARVDETLTSEAARSELAESRRSGFLRRKLGKGRVDRVAACLIAEQWLASAR